MGGSTETIVNLQVVPVMKNYNDLDKTLLLYDAQNLSNGMPAVLDARKQTMGRMRGMFKPPLMKRWGFEASSTAKVEKIDSSLLLYYLQTNIDSNITNIESTYKGFATADELGQIALQNMYSDYNITDKEFYEPISGNTYIYLNTIDAGNGHLDVASYKKPDIISIQSTLDSQYDTTSNVDVTTYLVEESPGILRVQVLFNYINYHVVVTTNGVITDEYDTTIIGGVTEGTTTNGNGDTVITTITTANMYGKLYIIPTYYYISVIDPSYAFLDDTMKKYSGTYDITNVPAWKYVPNSNIPNGVTYGPGAPPSYTDFDGVLHPNRGYTDIVVAYTVTRDIIKISDTELRTTCTISNARIINDVLPINITDTGFIQALEGAEEVAVQQYIQDTLSSENGQIVVKFTKDNHSYYNIINVDIAPQFFVDTPMPVMPLFPLKHGGSFTSNQHTHIALRDLGFMGDEFNDSLKDPTIMYTSLGFMFDTNDTSNTTVKLMYETFIHLVSTGILRAEKFNSEISANTGFQMKFEGLTVDISVDYIIQSIPGTFGGVGTYDMITETYYVMERVKHVGKGNFGNNYTQVPKVRKTYRKQVNKDYYTEVVINDLSISHYYGGAVVTNNYAGSGGGTHSNRMPIIREVLLKLPFNDYVKTVQMSLTLFIYTYKEVHTKWYQSGFFMFVMLVVAIVATVYTAGAASGAIGAAVAGTGSVTSAVIATTVAIGAFAGLILTAASVMGINLGKSFTKLLQVVAIVGAVASLGSMTYNYITAPSVAASTTETSLNSLVSSLSKASAYDLGLPSSMSSTLMTTNSQLASLASEFNIASQGTVIVNGGLATSTSVFADSVTLGLENTLSSTSYLEVVVPSVNTQGMLDTIMGTLEDYHITDVLKYTSKIANIAGKINDYMNQKKIEDLQNTINETKALKDKAEKDLQAIKDAQHVALSMTPTEIDDMFDTNTYIPDPLSDMPDLLGSLEVNTGIVF